jgi:hypothetical protein
MPGRNFFIFGSLTALLGCAIAQEAPQSADAAPVSSQQTVTLTVPAGAPLEIAIDKNVRVKKAGQEIHARVVQTVYAFDKVVVPAGTEVKGRIAKIEPLSSKKRVLGILNADFTPARKIEVEFTEIEMSDGKRIPLQAAITPGTGQPIQLLSTKSDTKKGVQGAAAKKIEEAKQQARETWNREMKQVKEPGKKERLEQYAMAQMPVRPQYLHSGTVYFAELQQPLNFGEEAIQSQMIAPPGTPPPDGSTVHALLVTPLSSATSHKGDVIEAVLSRPLFDNGRLIFPEGTRLRGAVTAARPAHRLHHNGQLRIVFRELVLPEGVQQKVVASLEGVQAARNEHVTLDSEGGAEATSPKTRYATTALSLALTAASFGQHHDGDDVGRGESNNGAAGGAAGFKLVGIALGLAVKSQPLGMALGAYGSARSVYANFIGRGHDVVFLKNTPMDISMGAPRKPVLEADSPATEPKK